MDPFVFCIHAYVRDFGKFELNTAILDMNRFIDCSKFEEFTAGNFQGEKNKNQSDRQPKEKFEIFSCSPNEKCLYNFRTAHVKYVLIMLNVRWLIETNTKNCFPKQFWKFVILWWICVSASIEDGTRTIFLLLWSCVMYPVYVRSCLLIKKRFWKNCQTTFFDAIFRIRVCDAFKYLKYSI